MSQIAKLGRQATFFLPLLLLVAVVGFWPTYFAALQSTRVSVHVHGLLMFTWMAALAGQAVLFGTGQLMWHRRIGRMWAPYIIVLLLAVWLHAMFWKAPGWGWWRGFALWLGQAT